jgi:hypothetical protein
MYRHHPAKKEAEKQEYFPCPKEYKICRSRLQKGAIKIN